MIKTLTALALLTTLSFAQKEALLVSVSDYAGTRYDLDGVKKDRVAMQRLFRSWGFHVTMVSDAQSMQLERYLQQYSSLGADDNFIFYYSGHGFHTKDTNGDEADGEDEALVLSDGERNELFIDDALFGYLNNIKARKMIMLDSCHSGTAFKAFGDKPKPKTIKQNAVDGIVKTKSFRKSNSTMNGGEYIVFSASQDTEESLDTTNGGLFSSTFYQQIQQHNGLGQRLNTLRDNINKGISTFCIQTDSVPHHPKLSASDTKFKYMSIGDYFSLNKAPAKPVVQKNIKVMGKESFNEGELLDFTIDTNNNSGYLTIFSIEENEPFIMYQSNEPKQGVFSFKSFNIQPPIECYKSCKNCASEKSVVYVAFSPTPIKINQNQRTKTIETSPTHNTKSFRKQKEELFKTVIKKFETTIY